MGEIRLLTVRVPGSKTVEFDLRRIGETSLDWRSLFEGRETIINNAMFECKWIGAKLGFRLPKVFDTMHAAHLLQNGVDGQLNHLGLSTLLKRYLGRSISKKEQLSDFGVDVLSFEQIAYAASDVRWLDLLRQELRRLMEYAEGGSLLPVFELDMEYLPILAEREGRGIRFDTALARALVADAESTISHCQKRPAEFWGPEVSLTSPPQVKKALETLIGHPIANTNADTLKQLPHEAANLVLQHRKAQAILTQTDGLLRFVHDNGRIYPSLNMAGTETGRIVSTTPTINNLSVDSGVRSCIQPEPGCVVVKADFSREELMITAVEFNVKALKEDIRNGRDIYRGFGSSIAGVNYEDVAEEDLEVGKVSFLAVTYGERIAGLISQAAKKGMTLTEEKAQKVIEGFDARFPEIRSALDQARSAAYRGQIRYGKSRLGRRRLLLPFRDQPTKTFLNAALNKAKIGFFGSLPAATATERLCKQELPLEGKTPSARAKNAARREAIEAARIKWAEWETTILPKAMEELKEAWRKKDRSREIWAAQQLMVNFRIQAGGSDVIRKSEILIDERLPAGSAIMFSNHDEVVVSCPRELAGSVTEIVQSSMREAFSALYPGVAIASKPEVSETWT